MTTRERLEETVPNDVEQELVEYLRTHPEFFARYPEVLEGLEIPHDCGKAVSLVEYQVSVLRQQACEMRTKLKELVNNARENEDLSQRLHRLTISLIESTSVDDIFANLYSSLRDDFGSEHAAIRIFAAPAQVPNRGLAEFVGDNGDAASLFEPLIESMKPSCGRIKPEQVEFLFPGHATDVQSCAVLPLGEMTCMGLLAVGSADPQRYYPGMGVVFLKQLSEILTKLVSPYLSRT